MHIRGIGRELAQSGDADPLYDVPHSTLSVTAISGGTAFNIIPEHCEFAIDLRSLPALHSATVIGRIEDYAREVVLEQMQAIAPNTAITVQKIVDYPGLDLAADHPAVTFMKRLLGRNDHSKVSYGTEAGVFSSRAGIVSLVCGPGSIEQAHKADEFLALSEIEKCHAFLHRLMESLEGGGFAW